MMKRGHHWKLVALLGAVLIIYLGHSGVLAQPTPEPIPTVDRPGQTDTSLPVRDGSSGDLPPAETRRPDPHTDIRVDPGIHLTDTVVPFNTVVPTVLLDTLGEPEVVGPSPITVPTYPLVETLAPGYDTTDTFPTSQPDPDALNVGYASGV